MSEQEPSTPTVSAVPQMNLAAQSAEIGAEIQAAIAAVVASQQFILGSQGGALENEIAALCGVSHAVGLASGTDALILALRPCGVRAGDEVITAIYGCRDRLRRKCSRCQCTQN